MFDISSQSLEKETSLLFCYSPTQSKSNEELITPFRRGPVCRGQFGEVLSFFTTDRPDYHRMPPPAGDNHG